jgi:hypothetical protein
MKFLTSLVSAAALTAALASAASAAVPVTISACQVNKPKAMSTKASGTHITYVNHGPKTAKDITFAVAYRNAQTNFLRRVTDVGTFTPGATVSHNFALYNDITYAGTATLGCSVVKIVWADGTTWTQ